MEKVLDERFIVVNKNDKNEYIEKINTFINQHKGFRPPIIKKSSNWFYNNLKQSLQRNFQTKDFIPLDGKFFYRGDIHTNSYYYHVCYNPRANKNVIVLQPYYGGYNLTILSTDNTNCSLSMVKRLYKKLVTEVIDQAILLREHKMAVDAVGSYSALKYHYNLKTHVGYNIVKAICNREDSCVNLTYSVLQPTFSGRFQLIVKKPFSKVYTFDTFKKLFMDNTISSNDFNVIHDEITKEMEKRLSEIVTHNNVNIEAFKNY